MVKMYQIIRDSFLKRLRDTVVKGKPLKETIAVNIIAFPTHFASANMYLLPGEDGDDSLRVVFLPNTPEGELKHPEFKDLRMTLNQILAKLEEFGRAAMS